MSYTHTTDRRAAPKLNNGMLLDVRGVADEIGCGVTKVYQLLKSGEIESIRIGRHRRCPRASLEKYVERKLAEQQGRGPRK